MVARDDLHRLIQQMTPSEVRHFKRHAQQHARNADNKTLLLFDTIAAQETYDEAALRKSLSGLAMLRQLSVAKNHLHQLLLRILGEMHSQQGTAGRLRNTLAQLEVLFEKGLIEDAKRRVDKAYRLAMRFDQFAYALELLRWHIKLLKKTGSREDYQALLLLQRQEVKLIDNISTESELRRTHDEILAILSLGVDAAQQQVVERIHDILSRPLLHASPDDLPFNSQMIFHYIHIHVGQYQRNLSIARRHYQEMIRVWESHPHRMAEEVERYVITLISHLQVSYQSLDLGSFVEAITKLRKLVLPRSPLAAKAFHYSYLLELTYALDTGNPPFSADLEEQIIRGLEQYGGLIDHSAPLAFYSNLAIYYLHHGDHNRSLKWINLIYNSKDQTIRLDIRAFAICLRLVLQYESGDLDLLSYSLQSLRRNLHRQKEQHPLQATVVKHLQRVLQKPGPGQEEEWQAFLEALQLLAREYNEALAGIGTLLTWLRSKVEGRTILEIVQAGE